MEFKSNGSLRSKTGCDDTFTQNTLCLENVFIAHPLLEGVDGIALDIFGNIWGSVNERNAIVVVTSLLRRVIEVFRNPLNQATLLLNGGPWNFPPALFFWAGNFAQQTRMETGAITFPIAEAHIPNDWRREGLLHGSTVDHPGASFAGSLADGIWRLIGIQ